MTHQNVTKEGIIVRVGQVWRDLDKRMDRYCRVVEFGYTGNCQTIPAAIMQLCRPNGSVIRERTTRNNSLQHTPMMQQYLAKSTVSN